MTLKEYKAKREFSKTPEPKDKLKKTKDKKLLFVIQKHDASHLHYDFRLELQGVLKSWAVPKGPSLDTKDKRLAMEVEDHPYDYHSFEGIIPKGNYGAGTVMIWDEGTYTPLDSDLKPTTEKKFSQDLKKGKIIFSLDGKKLHGIFTLFRIKSKEGDQRHWLLVKKTDSFVTSENILEEDLSATTGRTLDQIAHNEVAVKPKQIKKKVSIELANAPLKAMPHSIKPMLAFKVDEPFDNPNWLFEIKWDGYRAIAEVKGSKVELYSRNFLSFNQRYTEIVQALKKLQVEAIFDGEIVIFDEKGNFSFQALQNYLTDPQGDLRYFIFDLLYYNGHDLRDLPLIERKKILKAILPIGENQILQYSSHTLQNGIALFNRLKEKHYEGIVAKEIDSTYTSKRNSSWLKIKTSERQEAIICGFTAPQGGRHSFGSLILGMYKGTELHYIGNVGTGFDDKTLKNVYEAMKPLIQEERPFKEKPILKGKPTWISPSLICEVGFSEWTKDRHLRHPVFFGLRVDKSPKEVTQEMSISTPEKTNKKTFFTNLDKVFFPKEGYTKGDLIQYYEKISPYILPYLKNRPESLHRYPNGIDHQGFYQKNIDESFPDFIKRAVVEHSDGPRNYFLIQDKKSLLYAIQVGCIDLNPFNSRIDHLHYPDYMILDLDPEAISFEAVIETALAIHDFLEPLDIPHYCKTSGATGMHIYIPMGAKYTYEQTKEFGHLIAELIHQKVPKITSLERSPAKRQKKVYIDFLQNNFGQTVAAPYSVRPKPGATVSMPLEWSEVKPGLSPLDFTIENAYARVKKKGDIFSKVLKKGIDLKKCLKKLTQ